MLYAYFESPGATFAIGVSLMLYCHASLASMSLLLSSCNTVMV